MRKYDYKLGYEYLKMIGVVQRESHNRFSMSRLFVEYRELKGRKDISKRCFNETTNSSERGEENSLPTRK